MRPVALILAVIALASAGCVGSVLQTPVERLGLFDDEPLALAATDFYAREGHPSYLPQDGEARPFHALEEIEERIRLWAATYPGLVEVREIGRSLEERPIWDVVLTNKSTPGPKTAPFIDGGHHANEILGTELALYTVDLLLENYGRNETVTRWVDTLEIHTVPLVNPDGYVRQTRGNALGVNLNRNYDVDWGNPAGATNPVMGTLAHATQEPMPSVAIVAENSGPHAFSEPESQAIRDALASLDPRLAFYLSYHTPTNGFIAPWAAADPPFTIPPRHDEVLEGVLEWVRENTEYEAGKAEWGNFSAGLPYSASGSSMDWAYMRHLVPSFTLEIEIWYTSATSPDYLEFYLTPYRGLEYWLKSALPIPLLLLANAEAMKAWELPAEEPPLPADVPPGFEADAPVCPAIPHDEAPGRGLLPYPVTCVVHGEHVHGHAH